jgi:hypothetical protein
MQLGRGFRRLATIVDGLEQQSVDVVEATVADDDGTADGTLQVDLRLTVPVSPAEAPPDEQATGTETAGPTGRADQQDGAGETASADRVTGIAEPESAATGRQAEPDTGDTESNGQSGAASTGAETAGEEGTIACPFSDCDATFDSEPGMKIHRTKVHLSNGEATEDTADETPAYRDPDVLAEVYAEHDTFPSMRDALDADVSTQTIRRHMIKHGIHDPSGNSADAQDRGEAEQLLTDGSSLSDALPAEVDCPDSVTLEQLRESVEGADTLYDIQQEFGLDRERARDILSALDLLELVHGRVATRPQREELKTEIDRRIRESIDVSA